MRYLWEVLLEARAGQLSEEMLRFIHAPQGSPYMEVSLPCLNQTWLDENGQGRKEATVEVNTYHRFYSIFKDMFPPGNAEFPALRESLANLLLHVLAQNDVCRGMTREDYYKKLLAAEVEKGGFGEKAQSVFAALNGDEREKLLGGWLNSFRVGSALPVFLEMIHILVDDSIVYHNSDCPDEILIYTGLKKKRDLEQRIAFLVDTFLDIRYRVEVFYEYHFGIIGVEETMRIDRIAIC